jgi:hypothetical protein
MHCNECGDLIQVRCYCHTCYEQLDAENARLREVLSRLVTERTAGLASREAWDKARAALGKETT